MNRYLILAAAGVSLLAARVKADVIYDNISASTGAVSQGDAGVSLTGSGPLGDSFSTESTPSELVDVKLLMSADTPADGGSYTVSLFTDSATSPGTLISDLGTVLDSSLSTSPTESVIDVPVSAPISLAPSTRYWIEIGGSTTSADWSYDATNVGVGVASEFNLYAGGVSANDNFTPYQMTITTAAVPEPAALALTALTFAGAALRRRRRA